MRRRGIVALSEEERCALQKIANTRTEEVRRVQRARILLLAADGETQAKIAETVGLSRPSVILCLKKNKEAGWEYALADNSRTGRPAIISDATKMWVRNIACQKPLSFGYPQELWTITKLRKHIRETCEEAGYAELKNIAKSNVWGILNAAIGAGTFLNAAGSGYTAGGTGGSATHAHTTPDHAHTTANMTLSLAQIPYHRHVGEYVYNPAFSGAGYYAYMLSGNRVDNGVVGYTGGGGSHGHGNTGNAAPTTNSSSSLPPYLSVYMWKRTA